MLLTKEADYSIRIMRALCDGEKKTVKSICDLEYIPHKYAYKILKKLEHAGFLKSFQGPHGGYQLSTNLDAITLYDVAVVVDEKINIFPCVRSDHDCPRNSKQKPCQVHLEFERIQSLLLAEMKSKSMKELLGK